MNFFLHHNAVFVADFQRVRRSVWELSAKAESLFATRLLGVLLGTIC